MVNSDEFGKRIQLLMDHYELTASAFADSIDIGRSSISHILSGRNKPSLEFVLKITDAYQEVDLYWLLNGKGDFPKTSGARQDSSKHVTNTKSAPPAPKDTETPLVTDLFSQPENQIEKQSVKQTNSQDADRDPMRGSESRKISQIIVFYIDGTFETFKN